MTQNMTLELPFPFFFLSLTGVMQCTENSKIQMSKSYFCCSESKIYQRSWRFLKVSCTSCNYRVTLWSRSAFQNLESTTWLAKHGKGMLSAIEQVFVERDEIRTSLKTPAWEARRWVNGPPPQKKKTWNVTETSHTFHNSVMECKEAR